jgi:hypothetical protein
VKTPLQEANEWLEREKPTREEIQQSVDNLCHQRARPPTGISEADIDAAIKRLMIAAGGNVAELVLPDTVSKCALDYSPLLPFDDQLQKQDEAEESTEARLKRFRELKDTLRAPF